MQLLITCEHASHRIPAALNSYFLGKEKILKSHRGWDEGALPIAQILAKSFGTKLIAGKFSRLLVDLNRTTDNKNIFSDFTRELAEPVKEKIVSAFHSPYWTEVESAAEKLLRSNHKVLHLGIHSFTPVLKGKKRKTDIGLLFDSNRTKEKAFCSSWKKLLQEGCDLKIHHNLPYRGNGNGIISYLRQVLPEDRYCGIEVEVNQKLKNRSEKIAKLLVDSLGSMGIARL